MENKGGSKWNIESWVKIIGLILTSVTLFFTYLTFNASQKWKVAEFAFSKFKDFSENPSVDFVNTMLDYNIRPMLISDSVGLVTLTDTMIACALAPDSAYSDFSPTETAIRDKFDEYFEQLSLFNRFAKAGLVRYDEIKPYIDYQLAIIGDGHNNRKPIYFKKALWNYIDYYQYTDVQELFLQLGYDIRVCSCRQTCSCDSLKCPENRIK